MILTGMKILIKDLLLQFKRVLAIITQQQVAHSKEKKTKNRLEGGTLSLTRCSR